MIDLKVTEKVYTFEIKAHHVGAKIDIKRKVKGWDRLNKAIQDGKDFHLVINMKKFITILGDSVLFIDHSITISVPISECRELLQTLHD